MDVKRYLIELYGTPEWKKQYQIVIKKLKINSLLMVLLGVVIAVLTDEYIVGLAFGGILAFLVVYLQYSELRKEVESRRERLLNELPRFINKLSVLLKCGINLRRAFDKSAYSMGERSELGNLLKKICNVNVSEMNVYEQVGRSGQIVELARLSSVLMQNARKGNAQMTEQISAIAYQCYEKQRVEFKKQAEKKETLLLLPLVLLLFAVMIISVAPALMTFGGGMV